MTKLYAAFAVVSAGWLWGMAHGTARAEPSAALSGLHAGGSATVSGSLAHTRSAGTPRLRLTRMERVGPGGAAESSELGGQVSDREQMALSSAASDFLERIARSRGRPHGMFRTLRAAAQIADAPNRALCALTGADRARLDLFKRRVSFTWFVSW
jgi:hypothetical protein